MLDIILQKLCIEAIGSVLARTFVSTAPATVLPVAVAELITKFGVPGMQLTRINAQLTREAHKSLC